jgi:hypothetical protein
MIDETRLVAHAADPIQRMKKERQQQARALDQSRLSWTEHEVARRRRGASAVLLH